MEEMMVGHREAVGSRHLMGHQMAPAQMMDNKTGPTQGNFFDQQQLQGEEQF